MVQHVTLHDFLTQQPTNLCTLIIHPPATTLIYTKAGTIKNPQPPLQLCPSITSSLKHQHNTQTCMISDGHGITGFSLSLIVTVNVQVPVRPFTSVAVYVTTVAPRENVLPIACDGVGAPTPALSVAEAGLHVTTAVACPESVFWITNGTEVHFFTCTHCRDQMAHRMAR